MPVLLPAIVFVVFALLSAAGAFLVGAYLRGSRSGLLAALGTLAFFAVLAAAMVALFSTFAGA